MIDCYNKIIKMEKKNKWGKKESKDKKKTSKIKGVWIETKKAISEIFDTFDELMDFFLE